MIGRYEGSALHVGCSTTASLALHEQLCGPDQGGHCHAPHSHTQAAADRDGTVLDAPPLPEAIAYDPILGSLKLIARPGDETLLPRGGDRGFPHWSMWAELSPRFPRDLARALNPFPFAHEELQGGPSVASAIATR